jgi:hypothetical protein
MNLVPLINHPGYRLDKPAADSLARFERDHGVITITSAYRSVADQQALINRWNAGGTRNRPPYLYQPAMPAKASKHTDGEAFDTPNRSIIEQFGGAYGLEFNFAYDRVHVEYHAAHDTKKGTAGIPSHRPTIRQGSTGQNVRDLQSILTKYHGAKLAIDGKFGASTTKAVKVFQKSKKLPQDGIVGTNTWRALGQ